MNKKQMLNIFEDSKIFNKIISIIKKFRKYIYPLLVAVGTFLTAVASDHFSTIFRVGYLKSFGINSNLPINDFVFHPQVLTFICMLASIAVILLGNYSINLYFRIVKNPEKDCCTLFERICFLALPFAFVFIALFIFLMYINLSFVNFDLSKVFLSFYDIYIWRLIAFIGAVSLSYNYLFYGRNVFPKKKNKDTLKSTESTKITESTESTKDTHKIIHRNMFLITGTLLIALIISMLMIYLTNLQFAELGQITAKSEQTYPSFTDNNIKYIIIASMPDNKFLAIQVDSLLIKEKPTELSNKTIYRILDIHGYSLIDIENPLHRISN